jgi:hypothetical protein
MLDWVFMIIFYVTKGCGVLCVFRCHEQWVNNGFSETNEMLAMNMIQETENLQLFMITEIPSCELLPLALSGWLCTV